MFRSLTVYISTEDFFDFILFGQMFAQNLESVNISFTKFEYFQALFQVRFSSVLSNDMNELLSYRPTGP